jgi:hypothetical protein
MADTEPVKKRTAYMKGRISLVKVWVKFGEGAKNVDDSSISGKVKDSDSNTSDNTAE